MEFFQNQVWKYALAGILVLGGGFKQSLFQTLLGEVIQIDEHIFQLAKPAGRVFVA